MIILSYKNSETIQTTTSATLNCVLKSSGKSMETVSRMGEIFDNMHYKNNEWSSVPSPISTTAGSTASFLNSSKADPPLWSIFPPVIWDSAAIFAVTFK